LLTEVTKVASAVSAGYSSVEAREGELRTEINAALAKMRAYARDMEVRRLGQPCCCYSGVLAAAASSAGQHSIHMGGCCQ
jgi:hypothetical protein